MAFSDAQTKLLSAKLSEKFVRIRTQEGRALSYVEGWHAIAVANRILERLFLQHGERLAAANKEGAAQEAPVGIDKSELAIAVPKRVRDQAHRKFVATQPCLICGRAPSQAHHLRFAQPRALGRKVSDEWTVPLCVLHHRALHEFGAEKDWRQQAGVDALAEAQRLWQKSRGQPELLPQPQLLPDPSETTPPPEIRAAQEWRSRLGSRLARRRAPAAGSL